jgi:hypothetical protein
VVRKWSYINKRFNSSLEIKNLYLNEITFIRPSLDRIGTSRTANRYNFKVFRKTTRFKKFRSGLVGIVRKVYAKKKRRTENYGNLFIARDWSLAYLKQRQIVRFSQSLNLLPYESLSSDKEVFFKRLPYVENIGGVSIFTCSTNFVKALLLKTRNIPFLFFVSSHSVVSHTQSTNLEDLLNSGELGTNSVKYEGLLYPIDSNYFLTTQFVKSILVRFMSLLFKVALLISIELRKVMSYLVVSSVL